MYRCAQATFREEHYFHGVHAGPTKLSLNGFLFTSAVTKIFPFNMLLKTTKLINKILINNLCNWFEAKITIQPVVFLGNFAYCYAYCYFFVAVVVYYLSFRACFYSVQFSWIKKRPSGSLGPLPQGVYLENYFCFLLSVVCHCRNQYTWPLMLI